MRRLTGARAAANVLLGALGALAVFHVLVMLRVLPASAVWGGQASGSPGDLMALEMVANGAEVIHPATGLVVGYPPCPNIRTFKALLEARLGVKVVVGTHPIPERYLELHTALGTWKAESWVPILEPTMGDEETRKAYN